jgi:CelD/BcsL family acetyltransferase involved in cellulose biosynthesis
MPPAADGPRPNSTGLVVETHHSDEAFVGLNDDWVDLEDRAAEDSIFLTHLWQHTWWRELGGQPGQELNLVSFRDGGRLVGLAPTYRETVDGRPVLRFGGGLEVTDHLGVLVESGYEERVGRAFLTHCRECDDVHLDFHFLRSDGTTLAMLKAAADALGAQSTIEDEEVSPYIALPTDWETFVASLGRKDRHELRRKRRRLEEAGGWVVRDATAESLPADLEVFFDLHARSTRAKADFLTDDVKLFFRHLCGHLKDFGWLSLRTMDFEDRPVAAVLGFDYKGTLQLYNSGYDAALNRLSVGFVLMSEEVRLSIEAGCAEVDFLRGNERYKYELGAVDRPLVHLLVEPS